MNEKERIERLEKEILTTLIGCQSRDSLDKNLNYYLGYLRALEDYCTVPKETYFRVRNVLISNYRRLMEKL